MDHRQNYWPSRDGKLSLLGNGPVNVTWQSVNAVTVQQIEELRSAPMLYTSNCSPIGIIFGRYLHLRYRRTWTYCSLYIEMQPDCIEIMAWALDHKDQWREKIQAMFSRRLREITANTAIKVTRYSLCEWYNVSWRHLRQEDDLDMPYRKDCSRNLDHIQTHLLILYSKLVVQEHILNLIFTKLWLGQLWLMGIPSGNMRRTEDYCLSFVLDYLFNLFAAILYRK
jgi:hypothetical protein